MVQAEEITPTQASDFSKGVLSSGQITFVAGQTSRLITIRARGDATVEADLGFRLTLLNPSRGAVIALSLATGLIRDDDA